MDVQVVPASEADKPVIRRLLQLYLYDFTEFQPRDVDEHGEFAYPYLDHYWAPAEGEERLPFLIRADGRIAGFALVRRPAGRAWQMAEFFVLRMYRRHGVGRTAATRIFVDLGGDWQVAELATNLAAQRFWRRVISEVTDGRFSEQTDADATIQRFSL